MSKRKSPEEVDHCAKCAKQCATCGEKIVFIELDCEATYGGKREGCVKDLCKDCCAAVQLTSIKC